jgi:hypothetical protein
MKSCRSSALMREVALTTLRNIGSASPKNLFLLFGRHSGNLHRACNLGGNRFQRARKMFQDIP